MECKECKYKLSGWELLKLYYNRYIPGSTITRKDLVANICNKGELPYLSETTLDTTRRMLVVCGYLEDTKCAGTYRVLKLIEPDLTSTKLRDMYDWKVRNWKDPIRWDEKCYKKSCFSCKDRAKDTGLAEAIKKVQELLPKHCPDYTMIKLLSGTSYLEVNTPEDQIKQ